MLKIGAHERAIDTLRPPLPPEEQKSKTRPKGKKAAGSKKGKKKTILFVYLVRRDTS